MALQSSGLIRLSQIQTEFGGSDPISLSEYYQNASPDLVTSNNTGVPNTGNPISITDFYGAVLAKTVTYEIIGGGGGGAAGEIGNNTPTGVAPDGGAGGSSSFSGTGFTTVTAAGGSGGQGNAGRSFPDGGQNGQSSFYGAGGNGGQNSDSGNWSNGSSPAATSYGAGGGGGGTSFETNSGGTQALAGTRLTGTILIAPNTAVSVTIGAGGAGTISNSDYTAGAAGASGYVKFTVDGVSQAFTSSGTYTVPS